MEQKVQCGEETYSHYYRTELPNIIDELNLDPYEFRVYAHIKKIAGDSSSCWESYKTMAERCRMSRDKLIKCLENLCSINPVIKIPLVKKIIRRKENNGLDTCKFIIVNLWDINELFYQKNVEGGSTPERLGGVVRQKDYPSTPGRHKEEPIKKNTERSMREPVKKPKSVGEEISSKYRGIVQEKPVRKKRDIPQFLNIQALNKRDQQILANEFSDSELSRAIEDTESYHKKYKNIKNFAAFITQRCQHYKNKGK